MSRKPLELTREQVIAFRQRAGFLERRLEAGASSLRRAAWAGLQDSMPRAALMSIHARVEGAHPEIWDDRSLVQLWGPRYSVYVVARRDLPYFSLGRLPDAARGRERAERLAATLSEVLASKPKITYDEVGTSLGVNPNMLRYAAATGTVLIRWEGARASWIWTVPRPRIEPEKARLELARRHLHIFGPTTARSFAAWAGIGSRQAVDTYEALAGELVTVRTPIGEGFVLSSDEAAIRDRGLEPAPARLLPSGDNYLLLQGGDRELVVPDPKERADLWTPRVWPGGLLVGGEVVGTWRRADNLLRLTTWRRLSAAEKEEVAREAAGLPLPQLGGRISLSFEGVL